MDLKLIVDSLGDFGTFVENGLKLVLNFPIAFGFADFALSSGIRFPMFWAPGAP